MICADYASGLNLFRRKDWLLSGIQKIKIRGLQRAVTDFLLARNLEIPQNCTRENPASNSSLRFIVDPSRSCLLKIG